MFAMLRNHIEARVRLDDAEFGRCCSFFVHKHVRRRQYLLQEGDVCRSLAFVTAGCLRAYTVDRKGDEHIIQFALATWWISDFHSYLTGLPATYTIDALHDSDVLLLDRGARDLMFEQVPRMERYFRLLQEANYVATHRRIEEALSASAQERYLTFIDTYPDLVEQVPQNQIASYLGITPQ